MVHIADTKVARRYGDFFIRQIHKFEEVSSQVYIPFPNYNIIPADDFLHIYAKLGQISTWESLTLYLI